MEHVSSIIVNRMISAELISESEADQYNYGVQILIEKIISYSVIFGLAILIHRFWEILVFVISFSVLRKYTGGIHCRRFETCLLASTAVSISGTIVLPLVEKNILLYQGGAIMSIIIVILLGTINNPYIDWSDYEYKRAKKRARLIITLEASLLLLMIVLHLPINVRFYISYGIVVCAISMLLEIRKKGGVVHEEDREAALEGS